MANKIMVTGAGGYIGSIATKLFLQKGLEVVAIDNFSRGYKQPLEQLQKEYGSKQLRFYKQDLLEDFSELFKKEPGIELVVNYAAVCSVNESMEKPELYFQVNTMGTNNLIMQMMDHGITRIVFSSTCATYGSSEYVPLDENHPTKPDSPYGESKLLVEKMMKWYSKLGKLNYVILRYFNVCGASDDGTIGDSKKPTVHLMQNAVRGALGIDSFYLTCGTFNTPDGTPIRDYVNVVDLNEAHYAAIQYLLNGGSSELINLGTGTGNSVLEIINKVQEITGVKFEFTRGDVRKGESDKLIASIDKAKKVLGWEPKRSIEDSVKSLVTWYKHHPYGWDY
jgi:UDP-glucose 4-epimerase